MADVPLHVLEDAAVREYPRDEGGRAGRMRRISLGKPLYILRAYFRRTQAIASRSRWRLVSFHSTVPVDGTKERTFRLFILK